MKIQVGDIEVGYDRAGSGDPVLLVMGLGTTRVGWFNQFAFLSKGYDVTAFDNRGCGETIAGGSLVGIPRLSDWLYSTRSRLPSA